MKRPGTHATGALTLLLAGCGYFNTMYNAQRRFRDAQRAESRGNEAEARVAYAESIDKAAKSYRSHPDGRWADDALFLIGRARFELGEFDEAAAAMQHLLQRKVEREQRAGAWAYLGAASVARGAATVGATALDSAAALGVAGDLRPFVHLWRARAAFGAEDHERGWRELQDASARAGALAVQSGLEAASRSLALGDSARLTAAFAALLGNADASVHADSLQTMAAAAAARWGPAAAHDALDPVSRNAWPSEPRHRLALFRATLAAQAGDTTTAIGEATSLAQLGTGELADRARFLSARWRLSNAADLAALDAVRAVLLLGVAHQESRALLRTIRTVDVLLDYAGARGQPLALFAAAEIARDSLAAPALARNLFLAYTDVARDAPWVGKALLSAFQLAASPAAADSVRARLHAHPADLYVRAVTGSTDDDAFALAEQRLARGLVALRFDAGQEADRRDVGIARAVARLDSIRALALADSIELGCGVMMDGLGLQGVRADSVRAACFRSDSARVGLLMTIDTLLLREPRTREDSLRLRRRGGVVIDTTRLRP